jgi:acyl carrier protein
VAARDRRTDWVPPVASGRMADTIERDEILQIVRDRLADILEIEPDTISEGQSFVDDLDADSLALIELVESLEEAIGERAEGFRIDDEDLEDLKTVRDAVDYVYASANNR